MDNFHVCILKFVKSSFFWYWFLWRVCFSHTEFCEESFFLTLNFAKYPKTDLIFPLARSLKISVFLCLKKEKKWCIYTNQIIHSLTTPFIINILFNHFIIHGSKEKKEKDLLFWKMISINLYFHRMNQLFSLWLKTIATCSLVK